MKPRVVRVFVVFFIGIGCLQLLYAGLMIVDVIPLDEGRAAASALSGMIAAFGGYALHLRAHREKNEGERR